MTLYDKNIKALEEKYYSIAEKMKEIDIDNIRNRVYTENMSDGITVLHVVSDGRNWNLNSKWNPKKAAEIYAERYTIRPYGIYIIFGLSDGRCVRELLNKCDDTNIIIVCEPDIELFTLACYSFDYCDLVKEDRVFLCLMEEKTHMANMVQQLLNYTRIQLVEYCILPTYDVIYHESCEEFQDKILEWMKNEIILKETDLEFSCFLPRYILYHMKNLLKHKNIEQLKRAISSYNLEEIPAIIVSAGPSLDKNIHLLKRAQGRAFIIVVDAAIRSVIQSGVRPNLLCSVDPYSPDRFFDDLDLKNIYWVCCQQSKPGIVNQYADSVFYHGSYGEMWNQELENILGYDFPNVPEGGSVSNEAFMVALYLGFRKIILIGQDLAFTGGLSHTRGVKDALGNNENYIESRCIVQVEGIDGSMLETDFQMRMYKKWLEQAIQTYKDSVRVIDATEGGAKIEGTEIRKFEEVIETECRIPVDFLEIEQKIPEAFSPEQQYKLLKKLRSMKKGIVNFKAILENTLDMQERLLESIKKACLRTQEQKDILKTISEQNSKIENFPILDLVSVYARKEEYDMGNSVYAEQNLKPDQLIEKSISLLKGYRVGVNNLEKDFDEIIMGDDEIIPVCS